MTRRERDDRLVVDESIEESRFTVCKESTPETIPEEQGMDESAWRAMPLSHSNNCALPDGKSFWLSFTIHLGKLRKEIVDGLVLVESTTLTNSSWYHWKVQEIDPSKRSYMRY